MVKKLIWILDKLTVQKSKIANEDLVLQSSNAIKKKNEEEGKTPNAKCVVFKIKWIHH